MVREWITHRKFCNKLGALTYLGRSNEDAALRAVEEEGVDPHTPLELQQLQLYFSEMKKAYDFSKARAVAQGSNQLFGHTIFLNLNEATFDNIGINALEQNELDESRLSRPHRDDEQDNL